MRQQKGLSHQQQPFFKYPINTYNHSTAKIKISGKDQPLYLYLYQSYMAIREEFQQVNAAIHFYIDLNYVSIVQTLNKKYVFGFQEKNNFQKSQKPTISFRVGQTSQSLSQKIEQYHKMCKFINKQIEVYADHPNQCQTLHQRKQLIKKIKLRQRNIYSSIYEAHQKLFSSEWLDSFLFEDYQAMKEYNIVARQRAHQNQRKMILNKGKYKSSKIKNQDRQDHQIRPQNVDFIKCDQGPRFYDDSKKVNIVLKDEEKEDDIIAEELPNIHKEEIFDSFEKVRIMTENMNIQAEESKVVPLQSDRIYEAGIKLMSKPQKDKVKLCPSRGLQIERGNQGRLDRSKEQTRVYNQQTALKVRIWMRIFYKIQQHPDVTIAHIDAISFELNKLLNSQRKLPLYIQQSVNKTLSNMLNWKRIKGKHLN